MPKEETPLINTINEFMISTGENLPNHSAALMGRARFVRQSRPEVPTFRTKQMALRYAAWLVEMAELLPDDEDQPGVTFEQIRDAVRNS